MWEHRGSSDLGLLFTWIMLPSKLVGASVGYEEGLLWKQGAQSIYCNSYYASYYLFSLYLFLMLPIHVYIFRTRSVNRRIVSFDPLWSVLYCTALYVFPDPLATSVSAHRGAWCVRFSSFFPFFDIFSVLHYSLERLSLHPSNPVTCSKLLPTFLETLTCIGLGGLNSWPGINQLKYLSVRIRSFSSSLRFGRRGGRNTAETYGPTYNFKQNIQKQNEEQLINKWRLNHYPVSLCHKTAHTEGTSRPRLHHKGNDGWW